MDEYSTFLTGGQLHDLYSQIDGNFVGLGVELKTQDNRLSLVGVITGSPAERSGLRRGDRIIEVDGQLTSKLTADKAADMLQGAEGTTVDLVVERDGEAPRRVRVRREQVDVPSVDQAEIVDAASGLAYFKLTAFQKTTAADMDKALWALHRRGMKSLIIDLRGNPGGLLTASVEAADRFIESGTIVSTRGRNPQEDFVYTAQRAGTWNLPLVVLIDGDSASASEIFAGAMRESSSCDDHRHAELRQRERSRNLPVEHRQHRHSPDDGQVLFAARQALQQGRRRTDAGSSPSRQTGRPDESNQPERDRAGPDRVERERRADGSGFRSRRLSASRADGRPGAGGRQASADPPDRRGPATLIELRTRSEFPGPSVRDANGRSFDLQKNFGPSRDELRQIASSRSQNSVA
ncbi:MAG: S41 family peptidase [Pirellulales bacterium]